MRDATYEMLTSATQRIILAVGGLFVLAIMVVGGQAGDITLQVLPSALTGGLFTLVALWLMPRRLRLAQGVWLVGFAACASVTLVMFRSPEFALAFGVIPLLALALLGAPGAAVAALLTAGWMLWLLYATGISLPAEIAKTLLWGGGLLALASWASLSPWTAGARQLSERNHAASLELEEARQQKLEMEQYRQELLQANTELSRLTDRLKAMTQLAEEARRVKEEFVANVSHELRTPLNMIIGYTELMIKSPQAYGRKLPSRLLADLATIQRNSQHLVELINDVLDLSQVDAGRMALTRTWVVLRDLMDAAVVATRPLFQSRGLFLRMELPEEEVQVFCDATRVREVILNLLSNAGRFTDQGGVDIKAARSGDELVISIRDTGPGIAPEDQKKLFEPFQQLDDALHHGRSGSGLGLSISKRFVELHNGRMWLESEVGQGTTFYFSIPLSIPAGTGGAGRFTRWFNPYQDYEIHPHVFKPAAAEPAPRFVIVEQEDSLRHLFSRYLEGVETVTVPTLDEGVRELERSPAHALIVNAPISKASPGMQDITLALPFNTPVIGCWVPGRKEAARRMGVVAYLLKPISQEALLAALDSVDGSSDSPKQILLVDDDAETLRLFARIISSTRPHCAMILTTSGQEALVLMKERQPDVVLLDLVLGDIDGFEVLKTKGADDAIRHIPIIVVSSTDPAGMPVLSDILLVARHNGLSTREFLACIQAVSQVLSSAPPRLAQAQPESSPGLPA